MYNHHADGLHAHLMENDDGNARHVHVNAHVDEQA